MLSVILPTRNSERELQALLPVLVPAAVDGLVRQVIAADAGSTDASEMICEDAGALWVPGDLATAAGYARGEVLLILPADLRLRRGWEDSVRAHLEGGRGAALVAEARAGLLDRLAGPRRAGVLIAAEAFRRTAARDLASLRRKLGRTKVLV